METANGLQPYPQNRQPVCIATCFTCRGKASFRCINSWLTFCKPCAERARTIGKSVDYNLLFRELTPYQDKDVYYCEW